MKIVHVISYFQPHFGYQEYYLAQEQQNMGHEVYVVTSDRYYPFGEALTNRYVGRGIYQEHGLTVYRLPCLFEIRNYCLVKGMKRMLRKLQPEVVQAHEVYTLTPALPVLYKEQMNYRYVVDNHTFLPPYSTCKGKLVYTLLKKTIFDYAVSKSDISVAVTPACQTWFSSEFGVPKEKIPILPLGADHRLFRPDINRRLAKRRALGISDNEYTIVFVGRIDESKGIDILLIAFEKVHRKCENSRLIVVGGGSSIYVSELESLALKRGILGHVIFTNRVSRVDVPSFYNAADVSVWPRTRSLGIYEAMASGLPIILTKKFPVGEYPHSDTADRFIEYGNGFSFDGGNSDQLAELLLALAFDENLRQEMGQRSRKLVEDRMNWERIAQDFIKLYERI